MQALLNLRSSEDHIQLIVESALSKYGRIAKRGGGMCGTVYFFDQGEDVHPRWVVAKVPRVPREERTERNRRFLREIEIQHRTFYHRFVCWPFDYEMVLDTPVALYRASDGDLAQWIPRPEFSPASRLAVLVYLCSALRHCRTRGVACHQDLKPQNILMRNVVSVLREASSSDVFEFPMLADFGLANAGIDFQNAEGARPYMAPEQWLQKVAIGESDVFALGVIIHEVMTAGSHPYGGVTREWWPEPAESTSKKWLRPETWEKWAKAGNPKVPTTFLVDGVEDIVHRCMAPDPADRPTIEQVAAHLIAVLKRHDHDAGEQVAFQAFHADHDLTDEVWPYRDRQLERLRGFLLEESPPR
jgi:eukaryotic-like serine/threonine-protein kinase